MMFAVEKHPPKVELSRSGFELRGKLLLKLSSRYLLT